MQSCGFRPVASHDARVLILGTLPGPESLRQQQYYANKGNAFWAIMGRLFGAGAGIPYRRRLQVLKENHVALWDVCHSAYREGALDAAIDPKSVLPNDFARFLKSHRQVRLICFNGRKAAMLYRTHVLRGPQDGVCDLKREVLPSTSAAFAAMPFEEKFKRWSVVRQECER